VKLLGMPSRLVLLAVLAVAGVVPRSAYGQVYAVAGAPVTLVVDFAPGSPIDPERLRAAIARELGAPVTWQRGSAGGTLVVRQEGARVVVSFDRPDGRHDGRAIAVPDDPSQAERDVALLAGNVARDQTAQFERPAPPPPVPPPPVPAALPRPLPPLLPCHPVGPRLPAAIDFLPWVGMSSVDQGRSIRSLSVGALGALSGGVDGVAVSGVADVDLGSLCGLQIAGIASVAGAAVGVQVSGTTNVAQGLSGLQVAGAANVVTRDSAGLQVAAINVAGGRFDGLQAGAINVDAGRLHGLQIGAVNYASHADLQIGLVNIVADGRLLVDAWTKPEMGLVLAGVKHGGAHYHWIYAMGLRPADVAHPWATIGLGAHLTPSDTLFVDVDALSSMQLVFTGNRNAQQQEARVVLGYRLLPQLAIFAGPTLSLVEQGSAARSGAPAYADDLGTTGTTSVLLWPGLTLGIEAL
jgi:hypothetical protein